MKIFTGIAPNHNYDTIDDAVVRIVQRAQCLSLTGTAWSLAELSPDDEDFDWLAQWAQRLSPGVATQCLSNGQWKRFRTEVGDFSYSTGIGVLLFMLAVEIARRNASERALWAAISHSYFSPDTQKILFIQDTPKQAYKDAIELAARWLNLRHVFGMANLQNWYDTIYLQLGFTKRGFTSRLPEWLAGQNSTFAIQYLLEGPTKSKTFIDLWTALNMFRRKNISEDHLRCRLQGNPWILPEWIPELIRRAIAKPSLAYAPNNQDAAEAFLAQPRFSWSPPQDPTFLCRIINVPLFDLTEPSYRIMVADRIYGHLRRSPDGTYKADPSDEIALPATLPLLEATLVAPDGSIIQNQALQLWDENEEVSAFTSTGEYLDPWGKSMSTKKSYYLALTSDLDILPRPEYWHNLNSHTRVYLLDKEWSAQTQVFLEGSVLWESGASLVSSSQNQLDINAIEIHPYSTSDSFAFNQPIYFRISHPANYTITFIRSAGQSMAFRQYTTSLTITESSILQPYMFSSKASNHIELTLGIQQNDSYRVTQFHYRVEVPIIGVALLDKNCWTALDATQPLNIEQAKGQLMRFYLTDAENVPLLEGDTWIDNTWKTPKILQKCSGFGAPLRIQKSAYNASAFDPPQQIVREVINTGCVKAIAIAKEAQHSSARILQVQLTRHIEPDNFYTIVWWDQDGSYMLFQPEYWGMQDEVMYWSSPLPIACTQPLAVAVAYNGTWLGTWYSNDWSKILCTSGVEASTISTLMRWLHLPLLSQNVFCNVEQFSCAHAAEVLPIWLDEQCLLPDLSFTSSDEGWLSVVRKIFFNWQPESNIDDLAQRLSDPLDANDPPSVATQMVWKLSRVSPILMAKALRSWIEIVCIPQWGKALSVVLLGQLLYEMANVGNKDSLLKREENLLQEIATTVMKVDTNFIKKALLARAASLVQGRQVLPIDRDNLAIAMQVEPFRQLLSIHLIRYIHGQLEGMDRRNESTRCHRAVESR